MKILETNEMEILETNEMEYYKYWIISLNFIVFKKYCLYLNTIFIKTEEIKKTKIFILIQNCFYSFYITIFFYV